MSSGGCRRNRTAPLSNSDLHGVREDIAGTDCTGTSLSLTPWHREEVVHVYRGFEDSLRRFELWFAHIDHDSHANTLDRSMQQTPSLLKRRKSAGDGGDMLEVEQPEVQLSGGGVGRWAQGNSCGVADSAVVMPFTAIVPGCMPDCMPTRAPEDVHPPECLPPAMYCDSAVETPLLSIGVASDVKRPSRHQDPEPTFKASKPLALNTRVSVPVRLSCQDGIDEKKPVQVNAIWHQPEVSKHALNIDTDEAEAASTQPRTKPTLTPGKSFAERKQTSAQVSPTVKKRAGSVTRQKTSFASHPPAGGPMSLLKIVNATQWQLFCSFLIVMNALFVGIAAENSLHASLAKYKGEAEDLTFTEDSTKIIDMCFCAWFVVELAMNFIASPKIWFMGDSWKWNFFDLALVLWCLLETLLEGSVTKVSYIRTLRVFRTARVLRVMRVFRVFTSLRLMVFAIMQSMFSLLWVFILLLLLMYVFAICFLNAADNYIASVAAAEILLREASSTHHVVDANPTVDGLLEHYGGVWIACNSLFMAISGGKDWNDVLRPLEEVDKAYRLVFSFFVFFTVFGVLNVITGSFVDNFRVVSQRDREVVIQDELKREKKYVRDIQAVFEGADTDGSGMLSLEEFEEHLTDSKIKAFFHTLELDVSQGRALFQLLDTDGTNEVGIEEFVSGCTRLKGSAKSVDVNMLLYESEFMMTRMCDFTDHLEEKLQSIEKHLGIESASAMSPTLSWRPAGLNQRRLSDDGDLGGADESEFPSIGADYLE